MKFDFSGIRRTMFEHLFFAYIACSVIISIVTYYAEYSVFAKNEADHAIKNELNIAKSTAEISAYTDDKNLASEVILVLIKTGDVCLGEIKTTDGQMDVSFFNSNNTNGCGSHGLVILPLVSPIDHTKIGEFIARVDSGKIDKKAIMSSIWLDGILVFGFLITMPVMWRVSSSTVISPITTIVDKLKQIQIGNARKIAIELAEGSELTFVVDSINVFIDKINDSLSKEHTATEMSAMLRVQYQNIFEKASSGIVLSDETGRGFLANPSAGRLLQLAAPNNIVGPFCILERAWFATMLRNRDIIDFVTSIAATRREKSLTADVKIMLKNRENWLQVIVMETEDSGILQFTMIDITARKKSEIETLYKSEHDPMTGLLKKEAAEREIAEKLRHCVNGGVFMMDLDHFKPINDTYGHDAGDIVLREVAKRLKELFREEDIISRRGGDEFLAAVFTLKDDGDLVIICERILHNICQTIHIKDEYGQPVPVNVGISIGVAHMNFKTIKNSYEDLVFYADAAAYIVKKNGKNGFCVTIDGEIEIGPTLQSLSHKITTNC